MIGLVKLNDKVADFGAEATTKATAAEKVIHQHIVKLHTLAF
jgi:hypothetical protein